MFVSISLKFLLTFFFNIYNELNLLVAFDIKLYLHFCKQSLIADL